MHSTQNSTTTTLVGCQKVSTVILKRGLYMFWNQWKNGLHGLQLNRSYFGALDKPSPKFRFMTIPQRTHARAVLSVRQDQSALLRRVKQQIFIDTKNIERTLSYRLPNQSVWKKSIASGADTAFAVR